MADGEANDAPLQDAAPRSSRAAEQRNKRRMSWHGVLRVRRGRRSVSTKGTKTWTPNNNREDIGSRLSPG